MEVDDFMPPFDGYKYASYKLTQEQLDAIYEAGLRPFRSTLMSDDDFSV